MDFVIIPEIIYLLSGFLFHLWFLHTYLVHPFFMLITILALLPTYEKYFPYIFILFLDFLHIALLFSCIQASKSVIIYGVL